MMRRISIFLLTATSLLTGAGHLFAEGLTVRIENCPRFVKAGQDLDSSFQLVAINKRDAAVKDAAVELILKKNSLCPATARHALYSPSYFDGVLLQGGRESLSLKPGETITMHLHGKNTVPWDTPAGRTYYLCAVVLANDKNKTSSEQEICACCPVKVIGVEERPVITGYAETCLKRPGTVTILGRNFGSGAGKAVFLAGDGISINLPSISWGDSTILVRIPDDLSIRDGQQYFIAIRNAGSAEWLSNIDRYISACSPREPAPAPLREPPAPPFFH